MVLSNVTVSCEDRWQVYHRLQELDIECACAGFKPLQVNLRTPTEALQVWSVTRRVSASKQSLVAMLSQSWKAPAAQR
ncbi:MAG: Asr1405/Asl0597 family protein [Phormidesmis sp.]